MSLKYGVLGLLADQPLHGYDLKSRFEQLLGGTWDVNIGQIYTTLQRLERDGLVEGDEARGDRGRRTYRLTEGGAKALNDWLEQPEVEPSQLREEIYVKLLLLGRRANGRLAAVLAKQRRVYLQRLKDLANVERRGALGANRWARAERQGSGADPSARRRRHSPSHRGRASDSVA